MDSLILYRTARGGSISNEILNSGAKTVDDLFDVEEGEELKLSGDNETSDREIVNEMEFTTFFARPLRKDDTQKS